jgi:hypothetical protein
MKNEKILEMVYIKKNEAEKKICPLLTIALKKEAYCSTDKCMFWKSATSEYGICEIRDFLEGKGKF